MRSWTALAAFGLLALLATGCKKEHAPQGTAAAVPEAAPDARGNTTNGTATSEAPDGTRSASAAAVPTRIAGPAAFDLALVEGGALLAWSPPRAQGGGLYVQRLDARGNPREPARRLTQTDAGGEVIELAATGVGARVGVAWLESSAEESRTRALLVTPGEPAPPEPVRLALGKGGLNPGRSRLAVGGGRAGRMRVLYASGVAEDCGRGNSEPCTGYSFSELGDDGPRGVGGEWLRVPSPCPDVPPLLGAAGNALYYAVCADVDGARLTTAYGVDVQSEYAHAVQVLAGCTPRALLAPIRGSAWVVGRCPDGLRAAELGTDASRGARDHDLGGLEAVCMDGAITLRTGELELPLTQPLEGLHALLPEALAPAGSVALFTGEALVIVHEQAGELVLGRYACEHGRLAATK